MTILRLLLGHRLTVSRLFKCEIEASDWRDQVSLNTKGLPSQVACDPENDCQ